jgi:signal transduction histidine kinase
MAFNLIDKLIWVGIPKGVSYRDARSPLLTNVVSWLGIFIAVTLFILQGLLIAWDSIAFASLAVAFGFTIPLLLNLKKLSLAAKIFLSLYLPSAILLASVFGKLTNANIEANFETQYYDYRFFLMASAIAAIVLYDREKKWWSSVGLVYVTVVLILFDPIHNFFGVGYFQTGLRDPSYYFTNVVVVLAFLAQAAGFFFLNKNIYRAEDMLAMEVNEATKYNTVISNRDLKLLRYQSALNEIAHFNFETLSLTQIFNMTCMEVSKTMQVSRVSIWLKDRDKTYIECKALNDNTPAPFETVDLRIFVSEHPEYFQHLRNNRAIIASEAQQDILTRAFNENYLIPLRIQSMIDIPIILHGQLMGVLCHEQRDEKRLWDAEDQSFAESVTRFVGLAIETNRRREVEIDLRLKADQLVKTNADVKAALVRAEESDKLKFSFLANISHEIRTPMNAIMGLSELLQKPQPEDRQHKYARLINQRSTEMLTMLNGILDMAKLDSGQGRCEEVIGNIEELLAHQISQARDEAGEGAKREISLLYSNALQGDENQVMADYLKLNQIFKNLLSNALKFTQSGCIELRCLKYDQETLVFSVSDTGKGIAKENLEVIFLPFRQEDDSINRLFGGTGLGLSITKKIVALWGGKIWVESTPGKGSVFYFTIPFKRIN